MELWEVPGSSSSLGKKEIFFAQIKSEEVGKKEQFKCFYHSFDTLSNNMDPAFLTQVTL